MSTLGEISTIRDILMGEQIQEYNKQFNELHKEMHEMFAKLQESLKQAELQRIDSQNKIQQSFTEQIQQLSNVLGAKVNELNHKVETMSREDKHKLGQLLQDLGAQLVHQP